MTIITNSVAKGAGGATRVLVAGTLVAGLLIAAPPTAQAEPHTHGHVARSYALDLLSPVSSGVASAANGINDDGVVVGLSRPTGSARPQQAVLWEPHGDHHHGHALEQLDGSNFARAFDVSDSDLVVGEAFNAAGNSVAVRWKGESAPEQITAISSTGLGVLRDVNDEGTAVGAGGGKAVVVDPSGSVSVLTAPVGTESGATTGSYSAVVIDDDGTVGGRASISVPHGDHSHSIIHPVVWRDGSPHLLDLPASASQAEVAAVAGHDTAGTAVVAAKEVAVSWDDDGDVTVLPAPTVADFTHSSVRAATGNGVLVGYVSKFAGNTSFGGAAVAWDAHGPVDLNTRVELPKGVTLLAASDVNAAGQIVGTASTPDGPRGFVLTPSLNSAVSIADVTTTYGKKVTLSVTVSAGTKPASGEVTFEVRGTSTAVALVDGKATLKLGNRVPVGRHQVTVSYAGASGVTGSSASATLRVAKAPTTTRLTLATSTAVRKKTRVLAVAKVSVPGTTVKASGTVKIKDGRTVIATLKVRDGYTYGFLKPFRDTGRKKLRAVFQPTKNLEGSQSAVRTLTVRR